MEVNKKITMNVGGKYFLTYQSTLLKYPSTMLGKIYSDSNKFKVDDIQFFDRSSELFEYILNFYRTGIICKPILINKEIWEEEIRYWGLSEIETTVDFWESMIEVIQMIKDGKLIGPPGPMGMPGIRGPTGMPGPMGMPDIRGPTGMPGGGNKSI